MRDDKKYLYRRNLPYRTGLKASVSHKISLHVWHDLTHLYKVEQGERRLDVIEYIWYCAALGLILMLALMLYSTTQFHRINQLLKINFESSYPTNGTDCVLFLKSHLFFTF